MLDVTTDDSRRDIVAEGFDARIHFGEYIAKHMVAVRVSRGQPSSARQDTFRSHPKPKEPRDLLEHTLHQLPARLSGPLPLRVRERQEGFAVAVNGPLIVDDLALVLREHFKAWASLSLDKQGVTEDLAKGRLVRVLQVLLRIMAAMEKNT